MNKIGNYLREISVVVIGVAITLSVSVWLNNRNEKKDMALYLNAIKLELEENMKVLAEMTEEMDRSNSYGYYLQTHDKKSLNMDTLYSYLTVCYSTNPYTFKTNAFEMFKNSGIMRLMDDKETLMRIWDVYADLSSMERESDDYTKRKTDYMFKDLPLQGIDKEKNRMKLNVAPMYDFYRFGVSYSSEVKRLSKGLKEVLSKLEEANKNK